MSPLQKSIIQIIVGSTLQIIGLIVNPIIFVVGVIISSLAPMWFLK